MIDNFSKKSNYVRNKKKEVKEYDEALLKCHNDSITEREQQQQKYITQRSCQLKNSNKFDLMHKIDSNNYHVP